MNMKQYYQTVKHNEELLAWMETDNPRTVYWINWDDGVYFALRKDAEDWCAEFNSMAFDDEPHYEVEERTMTGREFGGLPLEEL